MLQFFARVKQGVAITFPGGVFRQRVIEVVTFTLASADFVPPAHAPVVYHVRSALLGKDWLTVCINRQQRLVIAHDRRMTARDLENRLFTDAALAPGGPLMTYLAGLRSPEIRQQAWDDALTALVPNLVRALFTNFPGVSGETVTIRFDPTKPPVAPTVVSATPAK